jgi:hypothetical protein
MSRTKTYLKRGGLGLLIIVFLLGAGGGFYFKSYLPNTVAPKSFPQTDGEIQLAGLDGPVDIYRDHMGMMHHEDTTLWWWQVLTGFAMFFLASPHLARRARDPGHRRRGRRGGCDSHIRWIFWHYKTLS